MHPLGFALFLGL
jgi:hypothetical protein